MVVFSGLVAGTTLVTVGCEEKTKTDKPAAEKPAAETSRRVPFDQLFEVSGGNVKPKSVIRYSGTTFTPDVPFEVQVVVINNEPFAQLIGRDAEVKTERGVTEIIRFY